MPGVGEEWPEAAESAPAARPYERADGETAHGGNLRVQSEGTRGHDNEGE